jgi:hypothetical protein
LLRPGVAALSPEDGEAEPVITAAISCSLDARERANEIRVVRSIQSIGKPHDGRIRHQANRRDDLVCAGCQECHTAHDNHGQLMAGREFAGGWEMLGPWGRVVTANISPHPDTYIARATKEEFIGRIKSFESLTGERSPIAPRGRNTIMPWLQYSGMTNEDLGAIYDYLKTLPPIQNKVESFPDAPLPPTPAPAAVPTPGS